MGHRSCPKSKPGKAIAKKRRAMAADVTIRGAGIFGLCCAWACAQGGAKVQVIDPAGPGGGASGGIVGVAGGTFTVSFRGDGVGLPMPSPRTGVSG